MSTKPTYLPSLPLEAVSLGEYNSLLRPEHKQLLTIGQVYVISINKIRTLATWTGTEFIYS